jgi:hypothetical protein
MKAAILFAILTGAALAQERGLSALTGLGRIQEKFGPEVIDRVFEMTGVAGNPQPVEWRITTHDPVERAMLHEFWVGARRATDEGLNDDYYPERLPKGFFKLSRLKLDSTQAFAMAEQVARDAKIGFDLVNYKLHGREYSDEPVWTLTLLDREEEIVASVHLSAESGNLLRTVWIRRRPDGRLRVEDSALGARLKPLASAAVPDASPPSAAPRIAGAGEFGIAEDDPSPLSEPLEPAAPAKLPAAEKPSRPAPLPDNAQEIPEIRKLNEAQEKAGKPR